MISFKKTSKSRNPVSSPVPRNQGIATLELVLSLPVLVLLFALILQTGASVIGQGQVTIEARHETWAKRSVARVNSPLDFANQSDGYVTESIGRNVAISRIFNGFPKPESEHSVLGNSWDFRNQDQLDLNRHANYRLQKRLVVLAGKNTKDNALLAIDGFAGAGSDVGTQFGSISGAFSGQKGKLSGFQTEVDAAPQKAEEVNRKERMKEKAKADRKIASLDRDDQRLDEQITTKETRIVAIDDRLKRAKDPQTDADKLEDDEVKELEEERDEITDQELPSLRKQKKANEAERKSVKAAMSRTGI